MEEHEWRIEVGYGLEGDITDIESNLIAQQYLIPKFMEEKYGEGLYDTVVALSQKIPVSNETGTLPIRGRYFYEHISSSTPVEIPLWVVIIVGAIIVVVIIILAYLAKKGKIKIERTVSRGRGYSHEGGGYSGPKGGGGRSGGGGAKGKW